MQIGASEVKAFLRHPDVPRAVLEDIYQILRIMLNKTSDQVDSDQEIPAGVISAREQMYYEDDPSDTTSALPSFTTPGAAAVPMKSLLKAQAEAPIKGDNLKPDSVVAQVTYMNCDKYGNSLVAPKDKAYEAFLRATWEKCQAQGLYFPFGFGTGKNLLKIKGLDLGNNQLDTVLSLKFSYWEVKGKTGFSCYGEVAK